MTHTVCMNQPPMQVAHEGGWALVDFEQMAAWWPNPRVRCIRLEC